MHHTVVPVTALLGLAGGDVGAVALNITPTQPSANSYVTVFPDGAALPSTSNVNFLADQNVANMALVGVGSSTRAAASFRPARSARTATASGRVRAASFVPWADQSTKPQ